MAKIVNPDALTELQTLLRDTANSAPLRTASIYGTVKGLLPEIRELKAKRFTDAEIRDMFASKGFEISLGTFRQYLQRANREAGIEPKRTVKKSKAKSNQTSSQHNTSDKPKPSDMAISPHSKTNTGSKITGHRLNDSEL